MGRHLPRERWVAGINRTKNKKNKMHKIHEIHKDSSAGELLPVNLLGEGFSISINPIPQRGCAGTCHANANVSVLFLSSQLRSKSSTSHVSVLLLSPRLRNTRSTSHSYWNTYTGRYTVNLVSARKAWAGEADIIYLHIKYIKMQYNYNFQLYFKQKSDF